MLPTTRPTDAPIGVLRELDRAFDRFWGNNWPQWAGDLTASYPVDIREDDNHITVEAELPGFRKDEIDVTMEQGLLSINAQRKEEQKEGEQHLTERHHRRVSRSFRLPSAVDESQIEAHLQDGILTLRLPKRDEVKPRKIEVK